MNSYYWVIHLQDTYYLDQGHKITEQSHGHLLVVSK